MRNIVIGQLVADQGLQTVNVWFRFPVPAGRQSYYAKVNAPVQAPGDYTATSGVDFAELAQLSSGAWTERSGFQDVIDPTTSLGTIQGRLVNIYNAAASSLGTIDTARLSRWGSSWNGTAWTMLSS